MIDVNWVLFVIASVAVIATPGQDMVLVMSRSISQGAAAGVATAAGVSTGLLLHTALATLGVGAIIQTSQMLFNGMKIVGALYLLYLGISLLRSSSTALLTQSASRHTFLKLYSDGAFSNVANPKIAVFYLAFLPQFVTPGAAHPTLSIASLGLAFALLTFLIKGPIGYCAGQLSQWFRTNPESLKALYRLSGFTLTALNLKLAIEKRP